MTASAISTWLEDYQRAWTSNEPDDIRALFTDDADYFTAPFRPAWHGQEEIVGGWLGRRDQPGDWTFRYEIILESPDLSLVRGWTTYRDPARSYSNLWLLRMAEDGRYHQFTEWWMLEGDRGE